MLGNVKHLPKKGQGVKEVLAVIVIVGNMGSRNLIRGITNLFDKKFEMPFPKGMPLEQNISGQLDLYSFINV
ncbi:hypothetical protein [Pedobacter frigiditerrae]|uniref:hypothetical protein n=1 Tax=Pedobacter frigiditerrae TaxID=2530452 RepID=UPI00293047D5|nr:hypothetical protein [Pedobacter frigiditerrae]